MAPLTCALHGPQAGGPLCSHPGCIQPLRPAVQPSPSRPPAASCSEPGCGTPLDQAGRCPVHSLGAPQGRPRYRLVLPWGTDIPVGAEPVHIGRSDEAGAIGDRLDAFPAVSRRHAVIRLNGDQLVVCDLDSTNGTFVNDEKLTPEQDRPIRGGDVVRIASVVRIEVREQP